MAVAAPVKLSSPNASRRSALKRPISGWDP